MSVPTLISAFESLLSCVAANGETASHAIIEEKDPTATLRKVTISDLRKGLLVVIPDEGRKNVAGGKGSCMSPLLAITGATDHNRACDAVIVHEVGAGAVDICYIDLKSGKPTGYSGQFKSTRAFLGYLRELVKEFHDTGFKVQRERFVILHTDPSGKTASLKKTPVRYSPKGANAPDRPEKIIVRSGDTLPWSKML